MIYSRYTINCDVFVRDFFGDIQIYTIGKDTVLVKTREDAIDKLLEMRENGVQIPEYVFIKLRG